MDIDPITAAQEWLQRKLVGDDQARLDQSHRAVRDESRPRDILDNADRTALTYPKMWDAAARLKRETPMPISPEQGMAFMRQMQAMQRPGGGGIGAPPAGSPTQGLIERLMSDNPGGLLGVLLKQRDPNQPGSMASTSAGPLPAMPPGGMPAAPVGMGAGSTPDVPPGAVPRLTADSSGDDIWNSYKAAGGGTDLSNNQFVKNSQNVGDGGGFMDMFKGGGDMAGLGMLGKLFSGMGGAGGGAGSW